MRENRNSVQTGANRQNWQNRYLVTGTVCGAALGLATAYFLVKSSEKNRGGPPDISTSDLLRSTIGLIGIVRGIASLGE